jgi:hypothetical protein
MERQVFPLVLSSHAAAAFEQAITDLQLCGSCFTVYIQAEYRRIATKIVDEWRIWVRLVFNAHDYV